MKETFERMHHAIRVFIDAAHASGNPAFADFAALMHAYLAGCKKSARTPEDFFACFTGDKPFHIPEPWRTQVEDKLWRFFGREMFPGPHQDQ